MKRITGYSLTAAFMAAFFILFGSGTFLAFKSIISREVILTDTIIFFSYQRPFLFGIIFAAEMMTGITGTVIAFWFVKKLLQKGSLFPVAGLLVLAAGIGMCTLAFIGNASKEAGHLITFLLLGLFMLILSVMLFQAHLKQKK